MSLDALVWQTDGLSGVRQASVGDAWYILGRSVTSRVTEECYSAGSMTYALLGRRLPDSEYRGRLGEKLPGWAREARVMGQL